MNDEELVIKTDPFEHAEYGGFWIRVLASLIDTVWLLIAMYLIAMTFFGDQVSIMLEYYTHLAETGSVMDEHMEHELVAQLQGSPSGAVLNYLVPAILFIGLWMYISTTPGKALFKLIIVDAKTGGKPSIGQWVVRYLGYFVCMYLAGLGFMWVGFDKRKQGWHDKMGRTVVVYKDSIGSPRTTEPSAKNGEDDAKSEARVKRISKR